MRYVGVDLHSDSLTACILRDRGRETMLTTGTDAPSIEAFLRRVRGESHVLLEASTSSFCFAERVRPHVASVEIANPHKLRLISMTNKKTDRVDARKLATFRKMEKVSGEQLIDPVYIPEPAVQDLRSHFTTYRLLRKEVCQTKNRIHALLKQHMFAFTKQYIFGKRRRTEILALPLPEEARFQIGLLFATLEFLERRIEDLEDRILRCGARYMPQIEILTSMKGVSVFTAIALVADVATVDRFPNSKKFASYMRSAPGVDSSNDTVHNKRTSKHGRKLSVTLLAQSLNHFRDGNPKLARWYARKSGHKARGKIRMALCRRVFTEIYQMLKKREYHRWRNPANHELKLAEYRRLLSRPAKVQGGGGP